MDHPTYFSPSVPPLCSSIVEESPEALQDEDVFTDEHTPSEIETVVLSSTNNKSPAIGITVADQHSETKESIVATPTAVSRSHKSSRIPRKEKAGSVVKSWEFRCARTLVHISKAF